MLWSRSASLIMMTRMSSAMARIILRMFSAWRAWELSKDRRAELGDAGDDVAAPSGRTSARISSVVAWVSSTTSCSRPQASSPYPASCRPGCRPLPGGGKDRARRKAGPGRHGPGRIDIGPVYDVQIRIRIVVADSIDDVGDSNHLIEVSSKPLAKTITAAASCLGLSPHTGDTVCRPFRFSSRVKGNAADGDAQISP